VGAVIRVARGAGHGGSGMSRVLVVVVVVVVVVKYSIILRAGSVLAGCDDDSP